jgi:hypothetical protein
VKRFGIVLGLSLLGAAAHAQSSGQVAVMGCQNAVVNQIKSQGAAAGNVRFSPNPSITETSKRETAVNGTGQFQDKGSGQVRRFTYDCTYNTRSAQTRVTVRADGAQ